MRQARGVHRPPRIPPDIPVPTVTVDLSPQFGRRARASPTEQNRTWQADEACREKQMVTGEGRKLKVIGRSDADQWDEGRTGMPKSVVVRRDTRPTDNCIKTFADQIRRRIVGHKMLYDAHCSSDCYGWIKSCFKYLETTSHHTRYTNPKLYKPTKKNLISVRNK